MLREIVIFSVLALATASKVSYENHQVFRITRENPEQMELIKQLEETNDGYSLWRGPSLVSDTVDLMVSPKNLHEFSELMNATNTKYEVYVKDVQKLIDTENPMTREAGFGWSRYHTLDEIYNWLDEISTQYSGKVQVIQGGKTFEGRPIKGVKLQFGQQSKPGVFIEGGIHAREWISPATVTYLVNEFLTSNNTETRKLAEAYDWYVFPSVNPDGYVYSHRGNRLWRKTMSKSGGFCRGADANRNWGFKWMMNGASPNPCADTYAGRGAFSEIETKTLSQYIKSVSQNLFAYISFHSYSQLLLFPYGHTKQHLENHDELYTIGTKAVSALAKRYGTNYKTGNVAETIYPCSGGSMDWVKATFKIPVVYTYELRDTGKHGFVLPADQIVPNGQEVLDSFLVIFEEAAKFGYPRKN